MSEKATTDRGANFEPELGMLAFSGGDWFGTEMQSYVERGLADLGERIAELGLCDEEVGLRNADPCSNVGAEFQNEVFTIRSYCWCDNERPGHEEGCPPNFVFGDFAATWYKYLGRGSTQSVSLSRREWDAIYDRCRASLAADDA